MSGLKTTYSLYSNKTSLMLLFHIIISKLLFSRYSEKIGNDKFPFSVPFIY